MARDVMRVRSGLLRPVCGLAAAIAVLALGAAAHTLPISYLRLQADTDYLHLELAFNAFEISFISELDDNKDGEIGPDELTTHGQTLADRVVAALKIRVGDKAMVAETAGMDPDMTGHHVRMRAHYKVDARRLPVTVESDLNSITSSSHLIQVTYSAEGRQQLGQLDVQSRKVVFLPFEAASGHAAARKVEIGRVTFGAVLLIGLLLLVVTVAATLLLLRRRPPG
jgi:hypothetical protein